MTFQSIENQYGIVERELLAGAFTKMPTTVF